MTSASFDEPLEIYPIYGLWHVPFWQRPLFLVVIVLLGSIVASFLMYRAFKKYKSKKSQITPWEKALTQLQHMKQQHMLSKEHSERYYVALTFLIKEYITLRFHHDVLSFTDEQMYKHLEGQPLFREQKEQLKKIFGAGQLIKFANHHAIEQQMKDDWQHTYDFVMKTKSEQP